MTAVTASRSSYVGATRWERTLVAWSRRLERAALDHMRRRAAGVRREATIQSIAEAQRDAHAAGALRIFGR